MCDQCKHTAICKNIQKSPIKLTHEGEVSCKQKIKSVRNVNLNKYRGFAEETCNMYHNSTEVDYFTKETFTRLAKTDSSPLELMQ